MCADENEELVKLGQISCNASQRKQQLPKKIIGARVSTIEIQFQIQQVKKSWWEKKKKKKQAKYAELSEWKKKKNFLILWTEIGHEEGHLTKPNSSLLEKLELCAA